MGTERRPLPVGTKTPLALLGFLESLGDETRLRLLRLLERRELGVAELCHVLQMPQSTVSRHLKVLGDEGWVRSRPQGTTRLYTMDLASSDPTARRLWLIARDQTEGWATVNQDQLRLNRHLSSRAPAAQAFFAGAAGQWDKLRGELYGNAFTQQALLSLLPPDSVVADLGCGTGQTAALLSPHVGSVIGVDQSAAMLKAAQRRTSSMANVDLRRGTLEALPIDDLHCDGALLVLALTYVLDPGAALQEMARILRPGGRAVVIDLLRHDRDEFRRELGQQHNGFDPEALLAWMAEAGLEGARCRELPPEPQAKGPALVLATAARPSVSPNIRSFKKKEE